MDEFREAVEYCRVKSLHSHGPQFTWRGVRSGEEVAVRLDRFMATSDWTDIFHASRALNLMPSKSDHLPILIEVRELRPKKKRKKKRFRFEEGWLLGEDCQKMVELGWNVDSGGDPFSRICNKIQNTRDVLQEWSSSIFGNLKEDIEKTRHQLAYFFDSSFSASPVENRLALKKKVELAFTSRTGFLETESQSVLAD